MVWANNSGGSSVAYLNITVVDELPTISYSPSDFQLMNNTAVILPLVPVITGSGEITSWEINATLPDGLSGQLMEPFGNADRVVDYHGIHGLGEQ